jgi:membrane associated rhomboid family serine protease
MLETLAESLSTIVTQTQAHLYLLLSVLGILLGIHIINVFLKYRLLVLGIYPRHPWGLIGIIFSPFLHGNFNHLFFNAIPLFVLMDFMLIYSPKTWLIATIAIAVISGFLTWLFARKAFHVGASSVITGYWSYLVFNMYQQSSAISIVLGFLCVYYFSGIFFGILPMKKSTSWEGHLFGLIAGIITAWGMTFPVVTELLT